MDKKKKNVDTHRLALVVCDERSDVDDFSAGALLSKVIVRRRCFVQP